MRARAPERAARCLLGALLLGALVLGGCGGVSNSSTQNSSNQLTVYSSLPLQGASAPASRAIVNGEKLALYQAGGHVGHFHVSYYSLDDSSPASGIWSPGITSSNAKVAAQDPTTIAYLGEYDSGATAISLPLLNAAGVLQISPGSSYVGLTSSLDAGQDEPYRFYLNGRRTFGRLVPGDQVEGQAVAMFLHQQGFHRLYVIDDLDAFDSALATIVATDAQRHGIKVQSVDRLDTRASNYAGEVRKVVHSGATAVFFSGADVPGVLALWRELYAADPQLALVGSDALANPSFTSQLGSAGHVTYLGTPQLAPTLYPPGAQRFFGAYEQAYGAPAPAAALYGYEAMQVTLQAIRNAGDHGNNRADVVEQFFAIRNRDSVLGRYSIQADGDTTMSYYAIDHVARGQPAFYRELHVPPTS